MSLSFQMNLQLQVRLISLFFDDVDQSYKLHYDLGELNKFLVLQGDREFVDSVFSDDDFILELEQYIS